MWTLPRRLLAYHRPINRTLLRRNDAVVGWFNSTSSVARSKQNNISDDSFKVSRLFKPTIAKGGTDTVLGTELAGKIKKADILRVLDQFSKKAENRSLCCEHGLDGEQRFFVSANQLGKFNNLKIVQFT